MQRSRETLAPQNGFSLIELLVVMLILGILGALAVPALLNQKSKAGDSQAKAMARTMQSTAETCANDNQGSYAACDAAALRAIEPTIPTTGVSVTDLGEKSYRVTASSTSGNTFSVDKDGGTISHPCSVDDSDRGGCPGTGTADGTW
jgi:type IV pilus assembly protein PilA